MAGALTGGPPPEGWPSVQHDWYRASLNRDAAAWRSCLTESARSIGVDGEIVTGADAVVDALRAYYEGINPDERIDAWITTADPDLFVWHGTIEPDTSHETKWCTVSTVKDGLIDEVRFFADKAALTQMWGRP